MSTVFIVHGSFGDSREHYIPWLKQNLEKNGFEVIAPNFPIGIGKQSYAAWAKVLNKYANKINGDTIFVGRSIGPIFIVKYLLEHKLKIKALFSISGFNCFINVPDYDAVNKTFFLDEIKGFEYLCPLRVCYISKNDPYVPYYLLDMFTKNIKAKTILKADAGHFNTETGYATFPELLTKIEKI